MSVTPFQYQDAEVRVVEQDGEPWSVLADLCKVLDLSNPRMVAGRLDPESVSIADVLDSRGVSHPTNVVTEGGLYEVVFLSRKPDARAFKRWVTTDVLPTIRRHGAYMTPAAIEATLTDPDFIIRLATQLKQEQEARAAAELLAEEQAGILAITTPKAQAWDSWLSSNVNYSVSTVAKALRALGAPVEPRTLFERMAEFNWVFRDRSAHGAWAPMQTQIATKRLAVKLSRYTDSKTGVECESVTVRITPKGAAKLASLFGVAPDSLPEQLEEVA